MIESVPFESLGRMDIDWLKARYHFSFANYFDAKRLGFGPLRVVNDDTIRPHSGFDPHGHRDMEIITYVRKGAISHADSFGNEGRIEAGDVQVMSAGTGIRHSEWNHEDEETLLYQIWIEPAAQGVKPAYAEAKFPKEGRAGKLVTLVSGRDRDKGTDALPIHQDAALLAATLHAGDRVEHQMGADRRAYLLVPRGRLTVNGVDLGLRDGAKAADVDRLEIKAAEDSELVLIDLP